MRNATRRRAIVALARELGWTVTRTRGMHFRLTKPGYAPVFTAYSPSDHRAFLNLRAQLMRAQRRSLINDGEPPWHR
jgi:hypothetical protein